MPISRECCSQRWVRRVGWLMFLALGVALGCRTSPLAEPGQPFDDSRTSLKGGTVSREDAARIEQHRRAAELGDPEAGTLLGLMYQTGQGVPRNEVESVRWFRRAAEANECAGQYHLGLLYLEGRGVPADLERAVYWLRRAADHRIEVQVSSFRLLYQALLGLGTTTNPLAASSELASIPVAPAPVPLRDPDSVYQRGVAYLEGQGLPVDAAHAVRFFRMAASDGHVGAQLELGKAYAAGRGARLDVVQAHKWFNLAAAGGSRAAREERVRLEAALSLAQLAEAEFLAEEWRRRQEP